MSYRVKDYWKTVLAEFDTEAELLDYVSSSQYTSSAFANDDSASLNYFQYDTGIHEDLKISGSLVEGAEDIIRITYVPGQDDVVEE
jgi:hypothetical protein